MSASINSYSAQINRSLSGHNEVEVASIYIHPQYNNQPGNSNNDQCNALIKLMLPITFGANVMPLPMLCHRQTWVRDSLDK